MSETKTEESYDFFQQFLNKMVNKELNEKETFSEDMVNHIKEVYRKLNEQKKQWLDEKKKEES